MLTRLVGRKVELVAGQGEIAALQVEFAAHLAANPWCRRCADRRTFPRRCRVPAPVFPAALAPRRRDRSPRACRERAARPCRACARRGPRRSTAARSESLSSVRFRCTVPAMSSRSRAVPLTRRSAFRFAVTNLLTSGCALSAVILRSTGIPFCNTPTLPVIDIVPGAAVAVKLWICRVPALPTMAALMSVMPTPRA